MKKLILFMAAGAFAFTSCNKAPEVSMTADKTTAKVGEVISFENTTEKGFNYVWDFGDGSSSEAFAPTHVYAEEGDYTVTLSGSDKKGRNFGTATQAITIDGFDDESEQINEDYEDVYQELNDQQTALMTSIVGEYTISAVKESTTETEDDCGGANVDVTYLANAETESYTLDFLANGSIIVVDHLGNKSNGNWSVTKDMYLTINVGAIRVDREDASGSSTVTTDSDRSILDHWFEVEVNASSLDLTWSRTVESLTPTPDNDDCQYTTTVTATLTK